LLTGFEKKSNTHHFAALGISVTTEKFKDYVTSALEIAQ